MYEMHEVFFLPQELRDFSSNDAIISNSNLNLLFSDKVMRVFFPDDNNISGKISGIMYGFT